MKALFFYFLFFGR